MKLMQPIASSAVLAGILFALSASGATNQTHDIAMIKQTLESRYPDIKVLDVQPSPIPGIYEVFSAGSVAYVDHSADYLMGGPLIETRTKTDLSQRALDARDSIDFAQLPLDKAIKTVRGSGERTIAVFADPDCPYCHNLEKELAGLNDVTVYTFLYPLTQLHPDARNKAHAIWCAADRSTVWHDWMILDQPIPAATTECAADPIDDVVSLGTTLKVQSTPTLFLENGHRMSGSHTASEVNAALGSAHADRLRAASNGGKQAAS